MVTQFNAFDLLSQPGAQAVSSSKAAKKKKAKPAKAANGSVDAPANGSGQQGAPAVANESPVVVVTGPGQVDVVELVEAVPILEKSARNTNRVKLWKEWMRQANDRSSKAIKYRAPDGSLISFKQLMLRCRALELTVEQCISAALSQDEVSALQQLLATFLPAAGDHAALAAAIARLSGLLAQDTGSVDTAGAATRALTCVISTLKDAKEDAAAAVGAARPTTLQERLADIDREASKQHGFLASTEKLAATAAADPKQRAATSSGISKAHVVTASELVKLYGQKFDLLQSGASAAAAGGGNGGASGPHQAAIKCLEDLKATIAHHLKEAAASEAPIKGAALSAEAKRHQAAASLKREEAALAQQASDLAGKMRLLESELAALRSQADEVETKRARLRQQQSAARQQQANGAGAGGRDGAPSAHHLAAELAAADQLIQLLDPSRASADGDSLAAAQAEHGNAAEQYMASVRNLMHMAGSNLADVPSKVEFVRQRISQAEKLASLGGPKAADKGSSTRDEAQRLLDETLRTVSAVVGEATAALEGMRARYPSFTPAQQAGLTQAAYEIEDRAASISRQADLAMAAVRGSPLPPAAGRAPIGTPLGAGRPVAPPAAASVLSGADGPALPPGGARAPYSGGAKLGPIQPPAASPKPAAAPAPAKSAPLRAANGASAPPPSAITGDGFKQVAGKKSRRAKA